MRTFTGFRTAVAIVAVCGSAMVFPALAAATPATLYVAGIGGVDASAATDLSNNCQAEGTPCATLSNAVSLAASGDTIEISGTLSEDASTSLNQSVTLADNPDGSDAIIGGSGADTTGLIDVAGAGITVTVEGLTLMNGDNRTAGGAIVVQNAASLTIINSTLSNNTADTNGGAIDNSDAGSVTINNSTLSGNLADTNGGAIDNNDEGSTGGTVTISDSTLTGNAAINDGGAIDNNDDGSTGGTVTISDSTLTNNSADEDGGAIDNNDGSVEGSLTVADSTLVAGYAHLGSVIAENNMGGSSGRVYMAGNVLDGTCTHNGAGASVWVDSGYNDADDSSCLGGLSVSSDATVGPDAGDLEPLDDYGGPTQTMLLEPGNVALGLIPFGTSITTGPGGSVPVACPATDQRGITSAAGQACDAGAVQQTAPTAFASGTGGDNAGAASDTNDCSAASTPCATVQGALVQIVPGGTVELSGTFSQPQAANVYADATIETNPSDSSAATIDGNGQDTSGLIDVLGTGADVTVAGLTLENGYNSSTYGGGAITHNVGGQLTVDDSTLSDNAAGNGGGISNNDNNTSGASLTIADSTLTGNSASDGGAIDNNDNGGSGGSATITDSTLYDNSAIDGGGVDNDDNGGNGGELTITQSTLAGDDGPQLGDEIANSHYGTFGSVYVAADVFDGSCGDDSAGSGTWTDAGYNAATDSSCLGSNPSSTDSATGTDAGDLGPFANNGGPTATLALAVDNPAIGLIPGGTSFTTGPTNAITVACPLPGDQRGVASVSGAACDAGAIQYIEQTLTFGSGMPSSAVVGQPGTNVTASSSSGLAPAFSADAATTNGACKLSGGSVTFAHAGTCVIDASQNGDQNVAPATTISSNSITVAAAETNTALSASAGELAATVTAVPPGGGTPSGTVEFQKGSQILGTASLSGGTATLAYSAPTNGSVQIMASYTGTSDYTASSSSALTVSGPTATPTPTTTTPGPTTTAPGPTTTVPAPTTTTPKRTAKPTITARLSSSQPRSRNGWWTAPVKDSFTCNRNGAKLTDSCPASVTLDTSGRGQQVTRTIRTTRGRTASVTVGGINIDLLRPTVEISGVSPQRTYLLTAPTARCHATEHISGIRSCQLSEHNLSVAGGRVIDYTARATSNAGSSSTRRASIRLSDIALIGARAHGNETYAVTPGHSYVLEVLATTKPTYLNAAPSPLTATPPSQYFAQDGSIAGTPVWRVVIRITPGFARFPAWTIGVRTGTTTTLLRLLT